MKTAKSSRRRFLQTSAVVVGGALAGSLPAVHAAGSDVLRVGLVGCGGRGTAAAAQAVNADPNTQLIAMADMFQDRLESSRERLRKSLGEKFAVKNENCFAGFDACKKLLATNVDVVVLATPPHFRPAHIEAAVAAGKHMFVEKPVAVDAPGVRSVLKSCAEAKKKNLAVVSGLCWRYHPAKRMTFQRIHDGAIGDIVAMQCNYNVGYLWHKDREPGWSDMEWQLRNWLYFTWLSGDFIVEQHIHSLDKMAWAMKDTYPAKAWGTGGRQVRTSPIYGHIFDHHAVVFEYASGQKVFSYCRQQQGCASSVTDYVMGSKGTCDVMGHKITGDKPWHYQGKRGADMYQIEHNELFASIRAGKPINDGERMAHSTLMAILGRMVTYTGKVITWQEALNSKQDLTPAKYEFGQLAVAPVAMPGVTKFS